MTTYAPELTMREARARYFADHGFGPDGGYASSWVHLIPLFGVIPAIIPNTPARKRAAPYHDLHHILTGYNPLTWRGECQISAWEVGGGCKDNPTAWAINLSAVAMGLVICPRACARAFVRGRKSGNLYYRDFDGLLARRVGDVQAELGIT